MQVGKIVALSVINGGPGPIFFAPAIIDYLFGGITAVKTDIHDVPNASLQRKIKKVCL